MKMLLIAALLLGASQVNAECANACSGHGFCGQYDKCSCYRNWMGNDCSNRVCPYDIGFVDLPLGDLNMNGALDGEPVDMGSHMNVHYGHETWPTDKSAQRAGSPMYDQLEDGHFYAECSNKGVCDRKSGTCECMDGYQGTACRRVACPENCSGHGTCETMQAMAENRMTKGATGKHCEGHADYDPALAHLCATEYTLWDRYKAQVCKCDPGYFGIDCAARHCPHGDDPLTTGQYDETQWLTVSSTGTLTGSFRLTFEDEFGETWDTMPIGYPSNTGYDWTGPSDADNVALASAMEAALEGIPNGTIEDVTVTIEAPETPVPGMQVGTPDVSLVWNAENSIVLNAIHAQIFAANIVPTVNAKNAGEVYHFTSCEGTTAGTNPGAKVAFGTKMTGTGAWVLANSADGVTTLTADSVTDQNKVFVTTKTVCVAPRWGFRAKIQFHKNPGNIHSVGADLRKTVTSDGLAAHFSGGDRLNFLGSVGHGDGTKLLSVPANYASHISAGDRVVASFVDGSATEFVYTVGGVGAFGAITDTGVDLTVVEDVPGTAVLANTMTTQDKWSRTWALYGQGTTENGECSQRGLCNHDDGLCECFAGYTNDDCGTQNALNA